MLKTRRRNEPSYSELMSQYEDGAPVRTKIPGLPPGWKVFFFHECRCGRDRDAVVLCERTTDDGDHGTQFVVWWVNMTMGGCYNGFYTDRFDEAEAEYHARKGRLK